MRTATKKAIKAAKFQLEALEKKIDRVAESALLDDRDNLLTLPTDELSRLREAISLELYTREACVDAELEARVEEEAEGVWEKVHARSNKRLATLKDVGTT